MIVMKKAIFLMNVTLYLSVLSVFSLVFTISIYAQLLSNNDTPTRLEPVNIECDYEVGQQIDMQYVGRDMGRWIDELPAYIERENKPHVIFYITGIGTSIEEATDNAKHRLQHHVVGSIIARNHIMFQFEQAKELAGIKDDEYGWKKINKQLQQFVGKTYIPAMRQFGLKVDRIFTIKELNEDICEPTKSDVIYRVMRMAGIDADLWADVRQNWIDEFLKYHWRLIMEQGNRDFSEAEPLEVRQEIRELWDDLMRGLEAVDEKLVQYSDADIDFLFYPNTPVKYIPSIIKLRGDMKFIIKRKQLIDENGEVEWELWEQITDKTFENYSVYRELVRYLNYPELYLFDPQKLNDPNLQPVQNPVGEPEEMPEADLAYWEVAEPMVDEGYDYTSEEVYIVYHKVTHPELYEVVPEEPVDEVQADNEQTEDSDADENNNGLAEDNGEGSSSENNEEEAEDNGEGSSSENNEEEEDEETDGDDESQNDNGEGNISALPGSLFDFSN
jgi:hypothetical protein